MVRWFQASSRATVGLGALLMAACGTAPRSLVEGQPYTRTDPRLYAVYIVSVDDVGYLRSPGQAIRLAPGRRSLLLQAAPGSGAYVRVQKRVVLDVEPCTRYVLAARRDSPMASQWELVIDRKEPVAPCDPHEELQRAQQEQRRQSLLFRTERHA